ncbi:MAG TPA: tol-pal system protein YbgF [Burkholderiaceae bacterium]
MIQFRKSALAAALLSALTVLPLAASAGILEDDEARKAILDLRAKVDALSRDLNARIDTKTDKGATIDVANQIETLRADVARLRGELEVLSNELSNAQKRQKDFYVDLDARIRKLEPQKVTVDGVEASVDQSEQRTYDNALAVFKAGDYKSAATALAEFTRRYPDSAYAPTAQYMLGTAYYAQRDCRNAIVAHQALVKNYADNPKAPDALLNIASCQRELKDKAEKKTLQALVAQYPGTEAAKSGKERLNALK